MNNKNEFKLIEGASLGKEQKIILAPDFFATTKLVPKN